MSTMQVSAEALRAMFTSAGFPAAKDWDDEKLKDNLFKINDIIGDDTEIDGEENKELAAALMVTIAKGSPVDIVGDASTGEVSDEVPAAAPEAKPKKGKNKEKKVATKKREKTAPDVQTHEKPPKLSHKPPSKLPSKLHTKPPKEMGPGKGYRITILKGGDSYSSTSVIHWLAAKGHGFEEAKKVLKKYKIEQITDSNLKSRLSVGRDKERSRPAKLSKEEVEQLAKIIK